MVDLSTSVVALVASLLVGGLAIHLGAAFALTSRNYTHAVVTALLGAVAWWLVGIALDELAIGIGGPISSVVGLLVWTGVIRWRYEAGWLRAGLIGVFAWIAALVVLAVLSTFGLEGIGAFGIPFA
jgi:hypothetical protein